VGVRARTVAGPRADKGRSRSADRGTEDPSCTGPGERHRIYKLLRLGVRFRPDWPLEITGVFAQVGEEAETGSSDSKLSPLSV
jgi:hypothetical protein